MMKGKWLAGLLTMLVLCLCAACALGANVLTLPEGLKEIEAEAFYGDTSLDEVVLPEGLERIGSRAFAGSSVKKINLPSSLSLIEDDVFLGKEEVIIDVEFGTYAYEWVLSNGILHTPVQSFEYSIVNEEIIIDDYVGDETKVVIPVKIEGYPVKSIGKWAFANSHLTNITVPGSVTSIGDYAFMNCSKLMSVEIKNGVKDIGNAAFEHCYSLINIEIPDSVMNIGDNAFDGCENLTKIVLSDGVTRIGRSVFNDCFSLTDIEIPDSVTSIGTYAFRRCSSLKNIEIPDSVTKIGWDAFDSCGLTSIEIPDSVTIIESGAFRYCRNLTTISIPDSVTSIKDGTFLACSSLNCVAIPDSVTSIGYGAFYGCSSLTSIKIPDGVTSIGSDAFYKCSSLTIYGKANSYAEEYAAKNGIRFSTEPFPEEEEGPSEPAGLTPEYYNIIAQYSIDENTYYHANLIKEYNGVEVDDEAGDIDFFMDSDCKVITDPDMMCKLWTVYMYELQEEEIKTQLGHWYNESKIWSDCALDFLNDEQLIKAFGGATASALKLIAVGDPTGLVDFAACAANHITDYSNFTSIAVISNIQLITTHLWESIDYAKGYNVRNETNEYEYDRVLRALEDYRYCALYYDAANNLCIPIVEDIIKKYPSAWDLWFDKIYTLLSSFLGGVHPVLDIATDVLKKALVYNDQEYMGILVNVLKCCVTELEGMAYSAMFGSLMAISEYTGIDVASRDALIAPFFWDREVLLTSGIYNNHLLLAQ